MDERFAPEGAIWVCQACGKTHSDKYGIEGAGSRGWDESCMLNAILCHQNKRVSPGGMIAYEPVALPNPPFPKNKIWAGQDPLLAQRLILPS